jgi:vancomycin resistance protein YoaR
MRARWMISASVVVASVVAGPVFAAEASVLGAESPEREAIEEPSFGVAIGEHASEYPTDRAHQGRASNVALAASLLDGAVVAPGETLSFNDRVGERTIQAGFAVAPEMADGRLHEGVGGGVCQVATALHVAAIEAGLEIVEHRTHSVPVSYAPAGLDATVYFGRIDFRVRNPHAFAIRVHAEGAEGSLVVRVEAAEAIAATTVSTRVIRVVAARERAIEDATVAPGARVIEERGRDGMVVRIRATRDDGTRIDRVVRYPSSERVVRVGPSP